MNKTNTTAIILGSGLGGLADRLQGECVPYSQIDGFCTSAVAGHKNRLIYTQVDDKKLIIMQGRFHFYEGYTMEQVTYPIKYLKSQGVENIIITNAAGAVNKDFAPGDLMLITDHINLMGTNPLIGKNDDTLGERFPDMSEVYNKDLIEKAENIAKSMNINIRKGVYAATTGPSFETPAEVNMMKILGADAVGMSTVPEAIVANYLGMNILGISFIANHAAGISTEKLSHKDVMENADKIKESFENYVLAIVKSI